MVIIIGLRMSKTTYVQRFENVHKFYDHAYHLQKATFKGSAQYFKKYCEVEKNYANDLLKLSQNVYDYIPDLKKQLPHIVENVKQICSNMTKISQFHFNYGERLREIGEICREEYLICKKKKEQVMKQLFEKSQQEHEEAKQKKNRNILNEKEKEICKRIVDNIDHYMEEEINRAQKFKEQLIIYFSITKKIAQKQIQLASAYSLKIAQYELQVKVPEIDTIEESMVNQYNEYGEDKIVKKNRDFNKQISVHRESLRDSIIKREKLLKVEEYSLQINQMMDKFRQIPEELKYPYLKEHQIGFFDTKVIPSYRSFSTLINSQAVKSMAFTWLLQFFHNNREAEPLLKLIKNNLKVKEADIRQANTPKQFMQSCFELQQNKNTIRLILALSEIYAGVPEYTELPRILQEKEVNFGVALHWRVQVVFIDCLLEGTIIIREGYAILQSEYTQILNMVIGFAREVFGLDAGVVVLLLLRKIQRALAVTSSKEEQNIEEILEMNIDYGGDHPDTYLARMDLGHSLIHFLTDNMCHFYDMQLSFPNLVKISLILQKIMPKNYFSAIEHMHACIKKAGFNFLLESDENRKILEGGMWRGEERLKNLTLILQQMDYDNINVQSLQPIARELSTLIGVGYEVINQKMMKQFMSPMHEIVKVNMQILSEQEAVDREGYILRLGICLAELDSLQPQGISYYDCYFAVLTKYLTVTEADYHSMLEHSCKTQLWMVMDENCKATQNCFDFCSLLYKPFEFLLESLKKLQVQKQQTQFIKQFSQFIKTKLNKALKEQIQNYLIFLYKSLGSFRDALPAVSLKPKWTPLEIVGSDQPIKDRFQFCEVTRRIFNLIFLKDQLQEIMSEFLDKQVYEQIDYSIFNVDKLRQLASKNGPYRELMNNISHISGLIVENETKLVERIADIAVFHFMRRIFNNLYFQEERGFFSSGGEKLSAHTFVKNEEELSIFVDLVARNTPLQNHDIFCLRFCRNFFRCYRLQLVNIHKFKNSIKKSEVIKYLQTDLAFISNLLKNSFVDNKIAQQQIQEPSKRLFQLLQGPTQRLMDEFTTANMGVKDEEEARCCLAMLNLREEDEKAEEFVNKYKKLLK